MHHSHFYNIDGQTSVLNHLVLVLWRFTCFWPSQLGMSEQFYQHCSWLARSQLLVEHSAIALAELFTNCIFFCCSVFTTTPSLGSFSEIIKAKLEGVFCVLTAPCALCNLFGIYFHKPFYRINAFLSLFSSHIFPLSQFAAHEQFKYYRKFKKKFKSNLAYFQIHLSVLWVYTFADSSFQFPIC